MLVPEKLKQLLSQKGAFTTAEANRIRVSNERLRLLVKSGKLERVSHGVYTYPDVLEDEMYVVQLKSSKIIYSHESALFLHDLTDNTPAFYSVTVPSGYHALQLKKKGFKVFSIKRELHSLGAMQIFTVFGNRVNAYGLERTVCDCMRSRNRLDISILTDAVKRYARRKDKDLTVLMQMAKVFGVTNQLRGYMEVLL